MSQKLKGNFQSMGLDPNLVKGLNRIGYTMPTPVQRKALPSALAGLDLVVMSRTGSGKTCVFVLPMIQNLKSHNANGVRAVVLSPTRELAMQTYKVAKDMAKFTDLNIINIVGGDSIDGQFDMLATNPDIIIATPGRLMHHLREISTFKLKNTKYLVFDEADRLFEMGFAEQLNEIIKECSKERQTLLFSATMPKQLIQFSRAGLSDPQFIRLDIDATLSNELRVAFLTTRSNEKMAALLYLVRRIIPKDHYSIIFTATKHHSELIHMVFNKMGVSSTVVFGSMDQDSRNDNLKKFRHGEVNYLIVTDVAARGIDIPLLNNVINYHLPPSPKLFIHRGGRAARQGRVGFAFSLVDSEELAYAIDIHKFLNYDIDQSTTFDTSITYTMDSMSPQQVHMGLIPQDILDEENEYYRQILSQDDILNKYYQISENGMIQYKKTRPEATKNSVKICRNLIKNEQIRHIHPLLAGMDPSKCNTAILIEKQNYIRMLQTFRPAQTVLESGIGTGTTATRTKKKSSLQLDKDNHSVQVMKDFRRVTKHALERNKNVTSSLVTTSNEEEEISMNEDDENNDIEEEEGEGEEELEEYYEHNEEGEDDDDDDNNDHQQYNNNNKYDEDNDEEDEDGLQNVIHNRNNKKTSSHLNTIKSGTNTTTTTTTTNNNNTTTHKPRLSKALKKKLKKGTFDPSSLNTTTNNNISTLSSVNGSDTIIYDENHESHNNNNNNNNSSALTRTINTTESNSYQDKTYYMSYGNHIENYQHETFLEDAMQPQSGLRSSEAYGAHLMEQAMLDLTPDDAVDMNRKKKLLRWDAKKRKFVKQTLDEMSATKKIRSEAGSVSIKSKQEQGEMYEKWKKKKRREISSGHIIPAAGTSYGDHDDHRDRRPSPNFKVNTKVKSELRNKQEIQKIRQERDENKRKNMKKGKRDAIRKKGMKSK